MEGGRPRPPGPVYSHRHRKDAKQGTGHASWMEGGRPRPPGLVYSHRHRQDAAHVKFALQNVSRRSGPQEWTPCHIVLYHGDSSSYTIL